MLKRRKLVFWLLIIALSIPIVLSGCSNGTTPTATPATSPTPAVEDPTPTESSGGTDLKDLNLPDFISFASYDVGSATFAQVAGLCEGVMNVTGIKTRQIVSGTDFGRMIPVRSGQVHFFLGTSNTVELASTGKSPFNTSDWGPQAFRQVWSSLSSGGIGVYVLEKSDINTIADLKGKRVTYITGNDSANLVGEAILAYAGLTWDDVEKCICSSPSDAYTALSEGRADCYWGGATAATLFEMDQTMGLRLVEFDRDDQEAWGRLRNFAATFYPKEGTVGVDMSEDNPKCVLGFVAPVVMTYAQLDDDIAYAVTKAIDISYDAYKDINVELVGWRADLALVPEALVVPFHDGAIKYLKEAGYWNDELQAKQDALLEKEAKLQELWNSALTKASEQKIKSADFAAFWDQVRKDAGY
ncbi:MAG: TAXI family TRAP transporter solute-binding subunit [Clostridiales bacterium]|nr:TAXI family TRAP transporter solute-binding subunit [Clostridiales bacterium]